MCRADWPLQHGLRPQSRNLRTGLITLCFHSSQIVVRSATRSNPASATCVCFDHLKVDRCHVARCRSYAEMRSSEHPCRSKRSYTSTPQREFHAHGTEVSRAEQGAEFMRPSAISAHRAESTERVKLRAVAEILQTLMSSQVPARAGARSCTLPGAWPGPLLAWPCCRVSSSPLGGITTKALTGTLPEIEVPGCCRSSSALRLFGRASSLNVQGGSSTCSGEDVVMLKLGDMFQAPSG